LPSGCKNRQYAHIHSPPTAGKKRKRREVDGKEWNLRKREGMKKAEGSDGFTLTELKFLRPT